jgi:hypothetical protein
VQADAALGPLRGFLPAVLDVARARHVVLVVDDAHLAGLSSRAALAETAGIPASGWSPSSPSPPRRSCPGRPTSSG